MSISTEEMKVDEKYTNILVLTAWNIQKQKMFDNFILFSIILNCVVLAADS